MRRAEPAGAGLSRPACATLWLTLCLDMIGFGLIIPVLPFHAERLGATPAQVTMLAAAFSLAQLIAAPVLGRLGDRHGRRRLVLISLAGSCAALVLLSAAETLAGLFVARLLSGTCSANFATAHAYVADRVPAHERARTMAKLGSAAGVGLVLGPVLGGLLATPSWPSLPFVVAAIFVAIAWLCALVWLPDSRRERGPARSSEPSPPAPRRRDLGALVAINLGFFAAFAAMESTFALLVEARLRWGAWESGLVFAGVGVVIVVVQGALVGRLVARVRELWTLRLGLVLLALGLAGIGLAVDAPTMALAALVVAAGNALISPALQATISRRTSADRQGLQLGIAASAASLGRVLGPATAGIAFERLGPGSPALIGAVVVVALLVLTKLEPAGD